MGRQGRTLQTTPLGVNNWDLHPTPGAYCHPDIPMYPSGGSQLNLHFRQPSTYPHPTHPLPNCFIETFFLGNIDYPYCRQVWTTTLPQPLQMDDRPSPYPFGSRQDLPKVENKWVGRNLYLNKQTNGKGSPSNFCSSSDFETLIVCMCIIQALPNPRHATAHHPNWTFVRGCLARRLYGALFLHGHTAWCVRWVDRTKSQIILRRRLTAAYLNGVDKFFVLLFFYSVLWFVAALFLGAAHDKRL